jgi:hypothetical protein
MLTVLRRVLFPLLADCSAFGCGKAAEGAGLGGGGKLTEGARNPLFGVAGADLVGLGEGMLPVLFLVLLTGKAGNDVLGGPKEGLDGRGSVVVIAVLDLCSCPASRIMPSLCV